MYNGSLLEARIKDLCAAFGPIMDLSFSLDGSSLVREEVITYLLQSLRLDLIYCFHKWIDLLVVEYYIEGGGRCFSNESINNYLVYHHSLVDQLEQLGVSSVGDYSPRSL